MANKSTKQRKSKKNDKTTAELFTIENMDDIVKDHKQKDENNRMHELLPKHPFRMLVCGASSTGKSNMALQLVYKPMIVFEKLHVYSSMINQSKYVFMKRHYDLLDEMVENECNIDQQTIVNWNDTLDGVVTILDELDPEYKNLILIDDFSCAPTKIQQNAIDQLFTKCRHKNCSVIMLTQLYYRNPSSRAVRCNISMVLLYQNYNAQELQLLQKELGSDLPTKNGFKKLYNYILSKKYDFMVIDNETHDKAKRYRKGFDGVYKGNTEDYDIEYFKPR